MSAALPIAALAALAAAGLAMKRHKPRPQRGSRSAPPARFRSEGNALGGQVYYHGSGERFDRFDPGESRTSYGIFFSRDPETARFYGKNLYKVLLFAKKPADLDDPAVLRAVAEQTAWGDPVELVRRNDAGEFQVVDPPVLARELARELDAAAQASPQARDAVRSWLVGQRVSAQDLAEEHREEVLEELLGDEDFWTDHPLYPSLPASYRRRFELDFFKIKEGVRLIEQDYGADAFYLNHQDDVLRAAEGMGYDAVLMTDPSSVGESSSCVVFSGDQVFILDNDSRD